MRRLVRILAFAVVPVVAAGVLVGAADMPAWAYPANPPSLQPPVDDGTPKHVPGSAAAFTLTELLNVFVAPVWHPDDHPPLPGIVARGREPGAMACGFCHLPTGAGKPENASLAGLPAEYIVQQVKDFVSGARRSAAPDLFPQVLMVTVAESVTEEEVRLAAEYFSSLNLKPDWIKVVETDTVPKMTVSGWQWAPIEGGGTEPIGQRIFEIADNKALTSLRDYRSAFTAYVPVGSVKRGEMLATTGGKGRTVQCGVCHGADLRGIGPIPGLVGRSPTYLVRQLYDFQAGTRNGASAGLMKETVAGLTEEDMVALAAYAASRPVN